MSYKLTRYHNRLGNNIRQVINACTAAHKDGAHGVIIPRHRCFKKTFIPIHNNNSEKRKRKTWFHTPKQRKCLDHEMTGPKQIVDLYLQDFLWTSPEYNNTKDLVLHVRSGDIFRGNGASRHYLQPPYSFYVKCIESSEKNHILLVTEKDRRNPIINQLEKDFSNNISIQTSSLKEDVKAILQAEELVLAKSSFSRQLSLFCPFLKKVHSPFWPYSVGGIDSINYKFPNYKTGPWKNSKEQREKIMSYKKENIKLFT